MTKQKSERTEESRKDSWAKRKKKGDKKFKKKRGHNGADRLCIKGGMGQTLVGWRVNGVLNESFKKEEETKQ